MPARIVTLGGRPLTMACAASPAIACRELRVSANEPPRENANLLAAWVGILLGFVAGAVQGLFFHDDNWLGGYASWRRRMVRLGHISFFGLALINLTYAVSLRLLDRPGTGPWPSRLFIVGAIAMPLVCYLAAYRKSLRHLFPIPVIALLAGAVVFIYEGFLRCGSA